MTEKQLSRFKRRAVGVTGENRQYIKYDLVMSKIEEYVTEEGQELLDIILDLMDSVAEHNNKLNEDDDF